MHVHGYCTCVHTSIGKCRPTPSFNFVQDLHAIHFINMTHTVRVKGLRQPSSADEYEHMRARNMNLYILNTVIISMSVRFVKYIICGL